MMTHPAALGSSVEAKTDEAAVVSAGPAHLPPPTTLLYLSGLGNSFESESLPGALPALGNSPKICPYGLYAEQISGAAFTTPRERNQRSWLYRIRPSVIHEPFVPCEASPPPFSSFSVNPNPLRWSPPTTTDGGGDFVDSLVRGAICGAGDPSLKQGLCIYQYSFSKPMLNSSGSEQPSKRCMCSADGDFLLLPELGGILVTTEMGIMKVEPSEICVVPRGVKFAIDNLASTARGYLLENFSANSFQLPQLGPLGANSLANPRHFQIPVASFLDSDEPFTLIHKLAGQLFACTSQHFPFDVVAWHGNYYPYKYDLLKFCTVGSVSYDHLDPSVFTVLTVPSEIPGTASCDLVVFGPRWMVANDTFRPPYFHRNCMTEFMGGISGVYDGKLGGGFSPGGYTLHAIGTAHGPDSVTFEKATTEELAPIFLNQGLAFMLETTHQLKVAPAALQSPDLQSDYYEACWKALPKRFSGRRDPPL